MTLQLYGIPTCGTCKKAYRWLEEHAIACDLINLKTNPPSKAQITDWVKTLGSKALRNTSGKSYRALTPEERSGWTEEQWIAAFSQDAMLLKRPLFVRDGQAIKVGFRGTDAEIQSQLGL